MANYLETAAPEHLARRVSGRIRSGDVRRRFTRLAAQTLRADSRNARRLTLKQAIAAPDWARRALAEGKEVHVFEPCAQMVKELRATASALRAAENERDHLRIVPIHLLDAREVQTSIMAEELFGKIHRMSFATIDLKARCIARERRRRMRLARNSKRLFANEEIFAAPGRVWRRVVSISDLSEVGRQLRNCLAGSSDRHAAYARALREDYARFWVLRDENDAALAAVMIDVGLNKIAEAGGPGNAKLGHDDPVVLALVRARALVVPTGTERWARPPAFRNLAPAVTRTGVLTSAMPQGLVDLLESLMTQRPQGVFGR